MLDPVRGWRLGRFDYDLDWLLRLRLAVARCGEMDCARWWNTDGQLGRRGSTVLRRGFPRTHHFAQARSVFAASAARCAEVFALPGSATLWWLGEEVEEAFDLQWEVWLDHAADWTQYFEMLAQSTSPAPAEMFGQLGLVETSQIAGLEALKVDPSGRSVRVAEAFDGSRDAVALLAVGFAKGSVGSLVVPYVTRAEWE